MTQWNCRVLEEWETDRLLAEAELCRMAVSADNQPYLLPLAVRTQKTADGDYVFRIQSPLYGMKMEYLQVNRRVALEFERLCPNGVESVVA
ncbi:MAG: pyridoxamine 5'-phosphate oxidase family protein, partial [Oscillospiraceae bacterium]|nr:pyridoxamine 5'-phosphate oxidase family protein [Oscillospiraceae bacterium]